MSQDHPHGEHPQELNGEAPVEPQEAPAYDLPTPQSSEAQPVLTAFLVVVDRDGTAYGTSDINLDVVLDRPAKVGDMYRAMAECMRDITASVTAERTAQMMLQATAQMAEVQRQQKIAAKLQEKGIRVPGR